MIFGPGLKIFKFKGVPVEITIFGLLIILIFVLPLGNRRGADLASCLLLAAGVFLTILLHEMAHMVVGSLLGAKVIAVKLDVINGLTLFGERPLALPRYLLMLAAGPVVNLLLWQGCQLAADHNFAPVLFSQLGRLNLFLAIVNLLPLYPLDGGRAAYAILGWLSGQPKVSAILISLISGLLTLDFFLDINGLYHQIYVGAFITVALAIWILAGSINLFSTSLGILKPREAAAPVVPPSEVVA